jgi:hypothetical protein
MAEPLFVMVKTALFPLHEPETLILDLSHPVSVDVDVLVAVLTGVSGVLVAVLTGVSGVLVAVSAGVLVGAIVSVGADVLVGEVVSAGADVSVGVLA